MIPYTPTSRDVVIAIKEVTEAGIYLPENLANPADLDAEPVEVVAAGPDCKQIKVGDFVLLRNVIPTIFSIEGKKYIQIAEYDCLGVLHNVKIRNTIKA